MSIRKYWQVDAQGCHEPSLKGCGKQAGATRINPGEHN